MGFGVKFRDAHIFDLTGYPYTISPKKFAANPNAYSQTQREMMAIAHDDSLEGGFGLVLDFQSY
jgi:hypothetical protein